MCWHSDPNTKKGSNACLFILMQYATFQRWVFVFCCCCVVVVVVLISKFCESDFFFLTVRHVLSIKCVYLYLYGFLFFVVVVLLLLLFFLGGNLLCIHIIE